MNLLCFAASHRPDSLNLALLKAAMALLPDSVQTDYHAYEQLDMPVFNQHEVEQAGMPQSVHDALAPFIQADAFMIAAPEYNWSCPGSLKTIIDWLSVHPNAPMKGKPIYLLCATPSERGGVMGLSHLKVACESVGAYVCPSMMTLGRAHERFAQDGTIAHAKTHTLLQNQLQQFMHFATQLTA